jgi:hypothetical protein
MFQDYMDQISSAEVSSLRGISWYLNIQRLIATLFGIIIATNKIT